MKEAMFTCACCHEEHPMSQYQEASGEPVCPNCLEDETVICSSCGTRIWKDDNAGDDNTPLCQRCYDRYYTVCDHCGAVIPYENVRYAAIDEDEEFPLCDDCFTHTTRKLYAIQDYYYKPSPIFYGESPRYFGVELEIDEAGESDRNAKELLEIANDHGLDRLYCKHDGSLNDGFELVTHPMTLAYHEDKMPWAEVLARAVDMGYTSHQAGTCGPPDMGTKSAP